jgi:hypothetical protein
VSQSPEEQRLLQIGVEPDVVGGASVRLHDADGVDQRDGGLRLRMEKNSSLRPCVSSKIGSGNGTGVGGKGVNLGGGRGGGDAG